MGKRIVVESGNFGFHNMGDVAMMQIAVERIGELWPSAQVEVRTRRPDLLANFCPRAVAVSGEERDAWLSSWDLAIGLRQKLPAPLSRALTNFEKAIWLKIPRAMDCAARAKSSLLRRKFIPPETFRRRLQSADLLIVCGTGLLTDDFAEFAVPLLDEMEVALRTGVPVVAFGQGLGPISDPLLLKRAQAVLPRLELISLREGRSGPRLLGALGVPCSKILVTGDDSIELALKHRPSSSGSSIGVNLRIAQYAGTNDETVSKLSGALIAVAKNTQRSLVPFPISLHENESDLKTGEKLLGSHWKPTESLRSPEDVIRLIGGCRIVVTGSYHGGVFALAQGIPIVAIVQSLYYEQKFEGLQQQFPGGCRILDLRMPLTSKEIENAILAVIDSAETTRESLLAAAARQVELSRHAYQIARELCPLGASQLELSEKSSSVSAAEISFPHSEAR